MHKLFLALLATVALVQAEPAAAAHVIGHRLVYKEHGRFGGWPANHGIWTWGDEILVGFSAAYFQAKPSDRHPYDNTKPEVPNLARSLDGGETWTIETPAGLRPPSQGGDVQKMTEPMDFSDPNFIMKLGFDDANKGPSWLWYSTDRGHRWQGPFAVPDFGQPAVAARTDYIVNGRHDAFLFLTAAKRNGREGRVFCARTTDGGIHWRFVSFLGEEPAGFSIMPSTVRLSPTTLITAVRVKVDQNNSGIDLYSSDDNARSWALRSHETSSTGAFSRNPPSMIRLKDGRLALAGGGSEAHRGASAQWQKCHAVNAAGGRSYRRSPRRRNLRHYLSWRDAGLGKWRAIQYY